MPYARCWGNHYALAHLPAKAIVLVNPLIPCGTAAVFREMGLNPGDRFGTSLNVGTAAAWRNDMTTAACSVLPEITNILSRLRLVAPNSTVRMSGSGATCFALFDTLDEAKLAARSMAATQQKWWIAPAQLH